MIAGHHGIIMKSIASTLLGLLLSIFIASNRVIAATTRQPSFAPSSAPTRQPSLAPLLSPTSMPSMRPSSSAPTQNPSPRPSSLPTVQPSSSPSSSAPTQKPSSLPTIQPSSSPSSAPTRSPTVSLLATLQSEGDAIYDLSQAMPSLVTLDGERSRMFADSIARQCSMI